MFSCVGGVSCRLLRNVFCGFRVLLLLCVDLSVGSLHGEIHELLGHDLVYSSVWTQHDSMVDAVVYVAC